MGFIDNYVECLLTRTAVLHLLQAEVDGGVLQLQVQVGVAKAGELEAAAAAAAGGAGPVQGADGHDDLVERESKMSNSLRACT